MDIKTKTKKLLEENIGVKVLDIGLDDHFDSDTKSNNNKSKSKQVGQRPQKSCYAGKETINEMKTSPPQWEKIFAIDKFDNGLIPKIYKERI